MSRHRPEVFPHVAVAGKRIRNTCLRDLFADDPGRFKNLSFRSDELLVDFSKQHIDRALLGVFDRSEDEAREAMQAEGVPRGRIDAVAAPGTFPGDRSSTTFLYGRLDARFLEFLATLKELRISIHA